MNLFLNLIVIYIYDKVIVQNSKGTGLHPKNCKTKPQRKITTMLIQVIFTVLFLFKSKPFCSQTFVIIMASHVLNFLFFPQTDSKELLQAIFRVLRFLSVYQFQLASLSLTPVCLINADTWILNYTVTFLSPSYIFQQ